MIDKVNKIKSDLDQLQISTAEQLENFRINYLSKKGQINQLFEDFKNISAEEKKIVGQHINTLKNQATEIFEQFKNKLTNNNLQKNNIDYTQPAYPIKYGSRHPVSLVRKEIIDIFSHIGFSTADGPEIEDDWHVFTGLNFPVDHPARDMQDTFFINKNPDVLLRTHTSSVQVRIMENSKPPIRQLFPGRVFRNEAISARSHCIFHQIEGLYIDTDVSFADLKQTLLYFAREMFGAKSTIRMRPSFFPFTEPSAEVDVSCTICGGKGCNMCKYSGFVEIMGCGMVDPAVLELSNIDSTKYTGYAFGMGIERIAILKHEIKDIRYFFENDIRFLQQFS